MIALNVYRDFWEMVCRETKELSGVIPVTVDEDVAKKIRSLPLGSVTLFWIPPSAEGKGNNIDTFQERNRCIVFVMEKYDPSRQESLGVLETTQPVIERVKAFILQAGSQSCSPWTLEDLQLSTLPETKFFANFAGWSVGFTLLG